MFRVVAVRQKEARARMLRPSEGFHEATLKATSRTCVRLVLLRAAETIEECRIPGLDLAHARLSTRADIDLIWRTSLMLSSFDKLGMKPRSLKLGTDKIRRLGTDG